MAIPCYLAMTAAEMEQEAGSGEKVGWMACHFSLSGRGLTNLPRTLPPGSLLMLDDAMPVSGHDPALVADQLWERAERLSCAGILLDFQRPGQEETAVMAGELCRRLPGQVIVSAPYADGLHGPVCLPPVPCATPLAEYLMPWKNREILLEWIRTAEVWDVTQQGATCREIQAMPEMGFAEASLHCHYRVTVGEDSLRFTLWRTAEDLESLRIEAEQCGVSAVVGLWQELGHG